MTVAKEKRNPSPYNAPRRAEQAAATRSAIIDAAGRLFAERGYAGTTMAAIAAEARVVGQVRLRPRRQAPAAAARPRPRHRRQRRAHRIDRPGAIADRTRRSQTQRRRSGSSPPSARQRSCASIRCTGPSSTPPQPRQTCASGGTTTSASAAPTPPASSPRWQHHCGQVSPTSAPSTRSGRCSPGTPSRSWSRNRDGRILSSRTGCTTC